MVLTDERRKVFSVERTEKILDVPVWRLTDDRRRECVVFCIGIDSIHALTRKLRPTLREILKETDELLLYHAAAIEQMNIYYLPSSQLSDVEARFKEFGHDQRLLVSALRGKLLVTGRIQRINGR